MTDKFSPELMRGSLNLMVLSVLAEESKYGYSLQKSLHSASRGMVDVKAGTLYPLLHRLEADKLIKSKWDTSTGRKRKWYSLTATGRNRLQQQATQWYEYADCIKRMLAPVVEAPKPA